MNQLTSMEAKKFVSGFESIFKPLPHLPKGIVDFLVNISPWFAGLGGLFGLLGGLSGLFMTGRNSMWRMVEYYSGAGSWYFRLTALISVLSGILLLMAFSGLKARKMNGWMYVFWANVLAVVQMIVVLAFGYGSGIVGSVISFLIGFYILFEMKKSYK